MNSSDSQATAAQSAERPIPPEWQARRHDWMKVIGMFSPDDELMKEIDVEGRRIREADRQAARDAVARGEMPNP